MKKIYKKTEDRNETERQTGRASYSTLMKYACDDMILNNNIVEVTGFENWELEAGDFTSYYDEEGNEISYDEYLEQEGAYAEESEIYQYFIISGSSAERLKDISNEIVFYNQELDMYVLGVTHCGTSWDYVPTDIELTENWEEL